MIYNEKQTFAFSSTLFRFPRVFVFLHVSSCRVVCPSRAHLTSASSNLLHICKQHFISLKYKFKVSNASYTMYFLLFKRKIIFYVINAGFLMAVVLTDFVGYSVLLCRYETVRGFLKYGLNVGERRIPKTIRGRRYTRVNPPLLVRSIQGGFRPYAVRKGPVRSTQQFR